MKRIIPLLWLMGAAFIVWSGTRSTSFEQADGFFLPISYPFFSVGKLLGILTAESIFLRLMLGSGSPASFKLRLFITTIIFLFLSVFTFLSAVNSQPHVVAQGVWVVVVTMGLVIILLFSPLTALFSSPAQTRGSPAKRPPRKK
ncbi:hypothetical protein KKF84_04090 [Myxococcota bacterium]|nr:hypothetical protein [Myxococcota bacterium]MBU1534475.1 hypothetical protein [Myxococcota bacterium]